MLYVNPFLASTGSSLVNIIDLQLSTLRYLIFTESKLLSHSFCSTGQAPDLVWCHGSICHFLVVSGFAAVSALICIPPWSHLSFHIFCMSCCRKGTVPGTALFHIICNFPTCFYYLCLSLSHLCVFHPTESSLWSLLYYLILPSFLSGLLPFRVHKST